MPKIRKKDISQIDGYYVGDIWHEDKYEKVLLTRPNGIGYLMSMGYVQTPFIFIDRDYLNGEQDEDDYGGYYVLAKPILNDLLIKVFPLCTSPDLEHDLFYKIFHLDELEYV